MKPEEAIEQLETIFTFGISNNWKDIEARNIALEAIEKQIPKKPVIAESAPSYVLGKKVYTEYKACGVCGDVVGGGCAEKSNYCSECGNKVDWSEEE